jgi:hypothetical protein
MRNWRCQPQVQTHQGGNVTEVRLVLVGAGAPPSAPSLVETLASEAKKTVSRSTAAQKAQSLARQVEAAAGEKARQEQAVEKIQDRYARAVQGGEMDDSEKELALLEAARRRLLVLAQHLEHLQEEKARADRAVRDAEQSALLVARDQASQRAETQRLEALEAIGKAAGPALEKLLEADRTFQELRSITARENNERADRQRRQEQAPAAA